MSKIDAHTWIAYLATLGCILACIGYTHTGSDAAQQYIFQIANSLISGALGAFTAMKAASTDTSTSLTVNPILPVEPASTTTTTTKVA